MLGTGRVTDFGEADRRRRRFRIPALVVLAALVAAVLAVDSVRFPWAFAWVRPLTGAPTLTGEWYGELTTPTGRRSWLALELSPFLGRCRSKCARLYARARVCDADGARDYTGRGGVEDWRGTHFNLYLLASDERDEGLRVIRLQAQSGTDVLEATTQLETGSASTWIAVDRDGTIVRPPPHPDTVFPVDVALRRGNDREFDLACRRLTTRLYTRPRSRRRGGREWSSIR